MSALFAVLLLVLPSAEPPVALEVRLSPAQARVGDRVELVIAARAVGVNSISIEPLPESDGNGADEEGASLPDLLVEETGASEGLDLLGALVVRRSYRLVPFATGKHPIRQLTVKVIRPDGSELELETPALVLEVVSVSPDEGGPKQVAGLKGLLRHKRAEARGAVWPWLILAVVLFVVGTAALIALNKRQPRRLRKLVELSPAERALRQLDRLATSGLLEQGRTKEFFTELSEIVRRYLGLRFRLLALEMTTMELLAALKRPLEELGEPLPHLPAVLETSDLVKFARLEPPAQQGVELIESAREIVFATRDDVGPKAQREAA